MRRTFIIILLLLPLLMQAEVLTLDSCVAIARQSNAAIRTSQLDVVKAHEVKRQVFAKFFPQVQGAFTAYHALHPLVHLTSADIKADNLRELIQAFEKSMQEDDPNFEAKFDAMEHGLSIGVSAFQPIFVGGRLVNGIRLADVGVQAATLQQQVSEREALEEVESTYYLVLGLQEKRLTVQSVLVLLEQLQQTAQTAYETGLITQADVLQVQLKMNEMRSNELRVANGIRLAKRLLCVQMGVDPMDSIQLDTMLLKCADKQPLLPREECVISLRPEHELLNMNVRAEQLRKKMVIGEGLPSIVLGGTYMYGNLLNNARYTQNGLLFLTASIPLTGWWETAHKIRHHNAAIEQALIKKEELTRKMSLQEQQAYDTMAEAAALMSADESAVRLAEENHRIQMLNYSVGLCTMAEALQANALLLQAKSALTDRTITYITARRRYENLIGKGGADK